VDDNQKGRYYLDHCARSNRVRDLRAQRPDSTGGGRKGLHSGLT
jgi:hypothetical protein